MSFCPQCGTGLGCPHNSTGTPVTSSSPGRSTDFRRAAEAINSHFRLSTTERVHAHELSRASDMPNTVVDKDGDSFAVEHSKGWYTYEDPFYGPSKPKHGDTYGVRVTHVSHDGDETEHTIHAEYGKHVTDHHYPEGYQQLNRHIESHLQGALK